MRIVALSPHAVEMLFAIGAGEQIVATTDYADFPEAAKAIPSIGGYYGIQIERVIELNPDLVVVWDTGNRSEDIEQLTKLGYRIYGSDPKTLEGIAEELEQLGVSPVTDSRPGKWLPTTGSNWQLCAGTMPPSRRSRCSINSGPSL